MQEIGIRIGMEEIGIKSTIIIISSSSVVDTEVH